jgi:hypothetical protein
MEGKIMHDTTTFLYAGTREELDKQIDEHIADGWKVSGEVELDQPIQNTPEPFVYHIQTKEKLPDSIP